MEGSRMQSLWPLLSTLLAMFTVILHYSVAIPVFDYCRRLPLWMAGQGLILNWSLYIISQVVSNDYQFQQHCVKC